MVRGNAKAEAQKKREKALEASRKAGSQLDARKAALKITCAVCKTQLLSYATLKQHMEARHPGQPLPPPEDFK